jgi:hypothetical protein
MAPRSVSEKARPKKSYFSSASEYVKLRVRKKNIAEHCHCYVKCLRSIDRTVNIVDQRGEAHELQLLDKDKMQILV